MAATQDSECRNITNRTPSLPSFCRDELDSSDHEEFQLIIHYVTIVVPILFTVTILVGIIGNFLVVLVVAVNKEMRSITNLLIANLAIADLLFIILCVPFTATDYMLRHWPYGEVWCKMVQYMIVVTVLASVYTLVLMSFVRYLAVVHPISSIAIRTVNNTVRTLVVTWILFILCSVPVYITHGEVRYVNLPDNRVKTVCVFLEDGNRNWIQNQYVHIAGYNKAAFQVSFFLSAFVIPLALICGLYVRLLLQLWNGVGPGGKVSARRRKRKRKVTKMVVVVVTVFACCWLPIQVILLLKSIDLYDMTPPYVVLQIVCNVLAYMNSCINPIIYAFLSENFRKAFKNIISCRKLRTKTTVEEDSSDALRPTQTQPDINEEAV